MTRLSSRCEMCLMSFFINYCLTTFRSLHFFPKLFYRWILLVSKRGTRIYASAIITPLSSEGLTTTLLNTTILIVWLYYCRNTCEFVVWQHLARMYSAKQLLMSCSWRKSDLTDVNVFNGSLQTLSWQKHRYETSNCFITVRKQSCGKVMFLHLSVMLFTGGRCTPPRKTPLLRQTPPDRHPPGQTPILPQGRPLQRTVRILLDCILILPLISNTFLILMSNILKRPLQEWKSSPVFNEKLENNKIFIFNEFRWYESLRIRYLPQYIKEFLFWLGKVVKI